MNVKVVIGKNFGDEGKGQTTDSLCRREKFLVVRHNGGAQAGHTVETEDFRFVFHQLGSGSFRGCPTFWSRSFLPDLLKLGEEMEEFHNCLPSRMGYAIDAIYADPDCACTTVYDVILNSLTEQLRGTDRHGSCGMGIFETVVRTQNSEYSLFLHDFSDLDLTKITDKLRNIRDYYTLPRLNMLKKEYPQMFRDADIAGWAELAADDNVLNNAAREMYGNFRKYVKLEEWQHIAEQYESLLFENAQGLMLDWDNEEYAPHLTASHTGLKNVVSLLREIGGECCIEVIYVTRTYVTRHGAGRLDNECSGEEIRFLTEDRTNVPNPWQGSLRFARHPAGENFFGCVRRDLEYLEDLFSAGVPGSTEISGFARTSDSAGVPGPVGISGSARVSDSAGVPGPVGIPHSTGIPGECGKPWRTTLCLTHLDETQGKMLFSDRDRSCDELCEYCREQAPGVFDRIIFDRI